MFLARFVAPLALAALLAGPAAAETLLRLAETAEVKVHPDELDAALRAEADAPNAAEAQARVNAAMERALSQAKQAGVVAATGFYQVWPTGTPATSWHATQSLALHSGDGPKLLGLVAALQGEGMALQNLAWQLAPETRRHALAEATKQALAGLRQRAEEAAGVLGLRFASFREVRLDNTAPPPPMVPFRAMAVGASVRSAPPPSAEAEDATVSARVEADAVLDAPHP
jgi:predicted secreted protein